MKINKVIKGEQFTFKVNFKMNTMTAIVRLMGRTEEFECEISEDFKYIILPETFTIYKFNFGDVNVGKLKLAKYQQIEAQEYNQK